MSPVLHASLPFACRPGAPSISSVDVDLVSYLLTAKIRPPNPSDGGSGEEAVGLGERGEWLEGSTCGTPSPAIIADEYYHSLSRPI